MSPSPVSPEDLTHAKVVILAGGLGTRLSEETTIRPKPMVEIGGRPVLWHIMKTFSAFGLREFVVCLGYKGYVIKEYFANYFVHNADVTIDLRDNSVDVHASKSEDWRVTLVDTGDATETGGRLRRVARYLEPGRRFFMTYGDGLADVDVRALYAFAGREGTLATVTATQPPGRFGALSLDGSRVRSFAEKPLGDGGWINGGFFVLDPRVLDYIEGDDQKWEEAPLERLAREGQLSAYLHPGFWHPLDTLRDKRTLDRLWASGQAPWKLW
jgi:glucose-1-phosphate cytidylyltransferase